MPKRNEWSLPLVFLLIVAAMAMDQCDAFGQCAFPLCKDEAYNNYLLKDGSNSGAGEDEVPVMTGAGTLDWQSVGDFYTPPTPDASEYDDDFIRLDGSNGPTTGDFEFGVGTEVSVRGTGATYSFSDTSLSYDGTDYNTLFGEAGVWNSSASSIMLYSDDPTHVWPDISGTESVDVGLYDITIPAGVFGPDPLPGTLTVYYVNGDGASLLAWLQAVSSVHSVETFTGAYDPNGAAEDYTWDLPAGCTELGEPGALDVYSVEATFRVDPATGTTEVSSLSVDGDADIGGDITTSAGSLSLSDAYGEANITLDGSSGISFNSTLRVTDPAAQATAMNPYLLLLPSSTRTGDSFGFNSVIWAYDQDPDFEIQGTNVLGTVLWQHAKNADVNSTSQIGMRAAHMLFSSGNYNIGGGTTPSFGFEPMIFASGSGQFLSPHYHYTVNDSCAAGKMAGEEVGYHCPALVGSGPKWGFKMYTDSMLADDIGLVFGDSSQGDGPVYRVEMDETTDDAVVSDGTGEIARLGRGETDSDITYMVLRNASGDACYIYPDAAGTGVTVSSTKP